MSRQWAQKKSGSNSSMSVQKSSSSQRPFTAPVYDAPAPKQTPSVQAKRRNVDWSRVTVEAQSPAGVQAKLSVGAPGDKYEQEADAMANKVMTMPALEKEEPIGREAAPEENKEEEVQAKPLAASITPLVQREIASEENKEEEVQAKSLPGNIQREMASEENEEVQPKLTTDMLQREVMPEEEEVQTKPLTETLQREAMPEQEEKVQTKALDSTLQRETMPEEEEAIQTKQTPNPKPQTPNPSLENQLNSSQGSGSPLPDDVRTFMEPRFGADFSQVRVHTGSDAVQMNRDVNAQAFAHGQDVYFGAGKAPGKDALTAHELTHVVQQTGGIEVQHKENIIQTLPSWEKVASDTACSLLSDERIYDLFINFYFSGQPNARKHLEHYLRGGGKDYTENVEDLFGANPRVRSRMAQLIDEQMTEDPTTTSNTLVGKGVDDGAEPPIRQSDYDSKDWRNANGNIDEIYWQVIGIYDPAGYNKFQITITDPYSWHPLEKRPTQCLHEAFERLKSKNAADYITRGTAEILLPPVRQSPDVPIESEL